MQIEVGKYYLTRDGRKVGPMASTEWKGLLEGGDWLFNISDGKSGDRDSEDPCIPNNPSLDLIAEWTDDQPGPKLSSETIDLIAIDSLRWHYKEGEDMEPLQREAFRIVLRYYGVSV